MNELSDTQRNWREHYEQEEKRKKREKNRIPYNENNYKPYRENEDAEAKEKWDSFRRDEAERLEALRKYYKEHDNTILDVEPPNLKAASDTQKKTSYKRGERITMYNEGKLLSALKTIDTFRIIINILIILAGIICGIAYGAGGFLIGIGVGVLTAMYINSRLEAYIHGEYLKIEIHNLLRYR